MSSADRVTLGGAAIALIVMLSSCGSPHPGHVDTELAIDLQPCIRREASCVQSGPVRATESLVPGADQALLIAKGGRISLPLPRPSPTAKLAFVAIGQRGTVGTQRLAMTVSGKTAELVPSPWFSRMEASFEQLVPAADARIELVAVEGTFDVVYLVTRWIE